MGSFAFENEKFNFKNEKFNIECDFSEIMIFCAFNNSHFRLHICTWRDIYELLNPLRRKRVSL